VVRWKKRNPRGIAFDYRFTLERQENGWWLVRFPSIPEALAEGETEAKARANALDCLVAALEGYMKAGRPLPRDRKRRLVGERVVLPSLVTAKLAVYVTMRARGWSKLRLAGRLGVPENSVGRLLDLRRRSRMHAIDQAPAKTGAELPLDLAKAEARQKAA
jgi:antitoxin HicB